MIDAAGFNDLRNYIRRRISHAKYLANGVYVQTALSDVSIKEDGTVRVQLVISSTEPITVTRVELYNNDSQLWAHQDCDISIAAGQTGILYWFDFTITEEEG